jgi:hypothetical protein
MQVRPTPQGGGVASLPPLTPFLGNSVSIQPEERSSEVTFAVVADLKPEQPADSPVIDIASGLAPPSDIVSSMIAPDELPPASLIDATMPVDEPGPIDAIALLPPLPKEYADMDATTSTGLRSGGLTGDSSLIADGTRPSDLGTALIGEDDWSALPSWWDDEAGATLILPDFDTWLGRGMQDDDTARRPALEGPSSLPEPVGGVSLLLAGGWMLLRRVRRGR